MRIRMTFAKTEAMRYTGHLDLFRALERTMRRAGLPLAYSQGFNPRPKLNLASALPLGYTSTCELAEFWLDAEMSLEEMEAALKSAVPPGIEFLEMEVIKGRPPKLQTQVQGAEYVATLLVPIPNLESRVASLLAADELPRQRVRKGKTRRYDLRPLIEDIHTLPEDDDGHPRLHLRLAAREGATGRPDEVLDALGIDPHEARICRTNILLSSPDAVQA